MRKIIILIMLVIPLTLAATEYRVTIRKDGSMYHITGTSYYLKITGLYEYGTKDAILDTSSRSIYVERSLYYGSDYEYDSYYYTAYEEISLPAGTIDQNGMSVWAVYVPTVIE